jgi:hypothetical protein
LAGLAAGKEIAENIDIRTLQAGQVIADQQVWKRLNAGFRRIRNGGLMPTKLKRQTRVEKPSERTLQRGLKLGREEWDRALLETVGNLGLASAEDIANAADLDIGRVETSLRRLAKAGQIRKTTEERYGVTTVVRGKSKR